MRSAHLLVSFASFVFGEILLGFGPTFSGREEGVEFAHASKSPNATGAVTISGVDMTQDGNHAFTSTWTANLNVTEVTNLKSAGHTPNDVITTSLISLHPPPGEGGLLEDSVWNTSFTVITKLTREAIVDGQKDDGDCLKTLGKQCVKDFKNSFTTETGVSLSNNVPGSCQGRISEYSTTILTGNFTPGEGTFWSLSGIHDATNSTSYEKAVTDVWPIIMYQKGYGGPKNDILGISQTVMSCLKISDIAEGSQKIGKVPSSASRSKVYGWIVLGVTGLVGGLLI